MTPTPLRAFVSALIFHLLFLGGAFLVSHQLVDQNTFDALYKWLQAHSDPGLDIICGLLMSGAALAASKAKHELAAVYEELQRTSPPEAPAPAPAAPATSASSTAAKVGLVALLLASLPLMGCADLPQNASTVLSDVETVVKDGAATLADVDAIASGLNDIATNLTPAELYAKLLPYGGATPTSGFKALLSIVVTAYGYTSQGVEDAYAIASKLYTVFETLAAVLPASA